MREEHVLPGRLGSAFGYVYGGREIIRRTCGFDAESVERAVRAFLAAP